MEDPISLEEYEEAIEYKDFFFKYGLELIEPREQSITSEKNKMTFLIRGPPQVFVVGVIEQNGQKFESLCMVQKDEEDTNTIECCFPKKGSYKLKVFAREQKEIGNYHIVLEFYIDIKNDAPPKGAGSLTFPSLFSAFTEKSCYLYEPKMGTLKKGTR